MSGIRMPFFSASRLSTSLYDFTTFTFTTGGQTGRTGPSLATLKTAYNVVTYPWVDNTEYFNAVSGIQYWTVPATGDYSFTVRGARGGSGWTSGSANNRGGYPTEINGTVSLTQGDIVHILVGQSGTNGTNASCGSRPGAGGGGTFIYNNTESTLLFVAGGGGGASTNTIDVFGVLTQDASLTESGKDSRGSDGAVYGGTNGLGGASGTGCVAGSPGGAGYSGTGSSVTGAVAASSFTSGGNGGDSTSYSDGGFGGGAGTTQFTGSGGGGYSGGAGGGLPSCSCSNLYAGGGGGSFTVGTATSTSSSIYSGNDFSQVIVTKV
jgi:hypothetical protein